MASIMYDAVVQLVDQLSPQEQKALIEHLQNVIQQRELTNDEWSLLLTEVSVKVPPGTEFSDRRQDWYDDDGR